jgi:hypothetical protein
MRVSRGDLYGIDSDDHYEPDAAGRSDENA